MTFQAKVNALPTTDMVYNQANLVYSYTPDPTGSILTNTISSNTVHTIINLAQYTVKKTVDKQYAQVGDYLVYTTTITNTGTVPLTNLQFADFIGIFLNFYQGSVYINGINYPSYNPSNQFPIDTLHPGDTATIVFGAAITTNPPVGYIPNISEVLVNYQVNSNTPLISKTVYSNAVVTYVPYAAISLVKAVDKPYAIVGDTLTYSFTATNTGTTTATNTLFSDTLQSGATFEAGSVLVNGRNKPNYDPTIGFTLGDMLMGQTVTVEFKVKVTSVPTPNTLKNTATTSFSYSIDPTQQPIGTTTTSNTVTTTINTYSGTLTKSVNKAYATIGDQLIYTIVVANTGTVPLMNVNFMDTLPTGATFVSSSVYVNGVNNPTANPSTGFTISNVPASGTVIVTFNATVTSIPTPAQIINTAHTTFTYQLTPSSSYTNGSLTSNPVTTMLNQMSVTHTKSVNKTYATLNDVLTYTSVITNTGSVDLVSTQFIDNLVSQLTFVAGSVKINNEAYTGYDPNVGFTLGIIKPGTSITITFDATVNSVPVTGYVTNASILNYEYRIDPTQSYLTASITSNTITTYINYGSVTVTKATDHTVVKLATTINYSFIITNTGNTILRNLLFKDSIQAESSFTSSTVSVNGTILPDANPNLGFSLPDIPVGQRATVSFAVVANAIPNHNELLNTANLTYSYYVDPNGSATTKTQPSNPTTVYVYDTIMSATKTVDKALAKLTDTLNFTITLKNDGNTLAQNVFFQDPLDTHITLVPNSVSINSVPKTNYDPTKGFNLDDIASDGTPTIITFAATINSRPTNNMIPNYAIINYNYTVNTEVISAKINTNTTQTYVAIGELTVTKAVDKVYATVGDSLAYTVTIQNTGSVNATALSLQDVMPNSTSFVTHSVVVDGIAQSTYTPTTSLALTNLTPGQSHVVTFNVHVDSLPASGVVNNTADVTFSYILTDTSTTTTTHSNTVTTTIKLGSITTTKKVDKAYATIGDTLNYTITMTNLGNATCTNVFFQDMIQLNARFVTGSVKINNAPYVSYNPNTGFSLPDMVGGAITTVTFAITILTLPSDYTIYNYASGSYQYYIDPSNPPIVVQGVTNTVPTVINVGSLTATKAVSKAYATIDDVLTYTVIIVNTGNILAKSVNFRDVIPTGLTFVNGSVTINGTSYSTYNPYSSFSLDNIAAGGTVVVTFNARVTSLPTPSLVSNTANLTFSYRIDPNGSDIPMIVNSNKITTQINLGSLALNKGVDLSHATAKNVLTYTIVVTNNGNVRSDNVIFTDPLQSDVTFNSGSVVVNGTTYPDYDPTVGFNLGNIESLNHVTVNFTVTVINTPTHDSVLNYAVANFSYKIDPNGQYYSSSSQSNTVYTIIIMPQIYASKVVDKTHATLQDILNYSVLVTNGGNTTLSSLFFTDLLSNGGTFISGTVTIDGVSYPTYDPAAGFSLPTSLVAGNTSLIQFQALATTLPSPPQVTNYTIHSGLYYVDPAGPTYPISTTSNTVSTNINVGKLSNTKSVDKMYTSVNDTVTYTSTITNTGNVNAVNLFFTDLLQNALTFIAGTVTINSVSYPSLDPTTGFSLSNLAPGQTLTVTFTAKVNSLPIPAYVTNTSNINFSYQINPTGSSITKDQPSNPVTTNIVLGKINATKVVDKPIATIGDVLNYTITLTNVGNVIANSVLFQDNLSTEAIFNTGSVIVNGVNQPTFNPITGFSLGDISIGNVITIQFAANVVSVPTSNQITNFATINFKFVVDPKQQPYSQTTYTNTVTTNIAYGHLNVTKAVNKQYATIGEQITYTVTVVNTGNINATNVVFLDPTPRNSTFVLGSVTINGTPYPNYNPSAGFNLNTMTPGQIITVVYKVQVIDLC